MGSRPPVVSPRFRGRVWRPRFLFASTASSPRARSQGWISFAWAASPGLRVLVSAVMLLGCQGGQRARITFPYLFYFTWKSCLKVQTMPNEHRAPEAQHSSALSGPSTVDAGRASAALCPVSLWGCNDSRTLWLLVICRGEERDERTSLSPWRGPRGGVGG